MADHRDRHVKRKPFKLQLKLDLEELEHVLQVAGYYQQQANTPKPVPVWWLGADPLVHLVASSLNLSNGATVTSWANEQPAPATFGELGTGVRPTYVASDPNLGNRPSVRGSTSGTNTGGLVSNANVVLTQPWTIYAVFNLTAQSPANFLFDFDNLQNMMIFDNDPFGIQMGAGKSYATFAPGSYVVIAEYNDGSDLLYIGGGTAETLTSPATRGAVNHLLHLMAWSSGGNNQLIGTLAEFALFNRALTDEEKDFGGNHAKDMYGVSYTNVFTPPTGTNLYVDVNAGGGGDGTIGSPWTFPEAFIPPRAEITPGSTVWLRAGTYPIPAYQSGVFINAVAGTSGNPVTIRSFTGESVIVDMDSAGQFNNPRCNWTGDYVDFRDITWMSSSPKPRWLDPNDTTSPQFHLAMTVAR